MVEAGILEQREQVAAVDELNPKATQEIEELLEETERTQKKQQTTNGGWYFRMPAAGVRYYSF